MTHSTWAESFAPNSTNCQMGRSLMAIFNWFSERREERAHQQQTREWIEENQRQIRLREELVSRFEREFRTASTPCQRASVTNRARSRDVAGWPVLFEFLPYDIRTWASKYEAEVLRAPQYIKQAKEFFSLVEEHGLDAIRFGPYRRMLQKLQEDLFDGDDPESLDEMHECAGRKIEFYSRIVEGEFPEDIENDFEYRVELKRRAESEPAEEPQSPSTDATVDQMVPPAPVYQREDLVQISPTAAVLQARKELENSVRTCVMRLPNVAADITMFNMIELLIERGAIDKRGHYQLHQLRLFANKVAHEPEMQITAEDAIRFQQDAQSIMVRLKQR